MTAGGCFAPVSVRDGYYPSLDRTTPDQGIIAPTSIYSCQRTANRSLLPTPRSRKTGFGRTDRTKAFTADGPDSPLFGVDFATLGLLTIGHYVTVAEMQALACFRFIRTSPSKIFYVSLVYLFFRVTILQ